MTFAISWTQFFPPRDGAPLTEANLPNQAGKVFIVTGGSSGIGYELSRILYGAGGKVYMLTRSKEHAEDAISRIRAHYADDSDRSSKTGSLEFIYMDLIDFTTVKAAAQQFLDSEGPDGRLDVLFNNAGTGALKDAPKTLQGHKYHFSTNSLGPYLLTRLLAPILSQTAKTAPKDSVRVVWTASVLVELMSPKDGVRKEYLQDPFSIRNQNELYGSSKAANWFLASEFARRQPEAGVFGSGVVHLGSGQPGELFHGHMTHRSLLVDLRRPPFPPTSGARCRDIYVDGLLG
ncbi:putative steroid dehydrogenase [Hypoxylon cercidicola]|nr:putative steroid dehydrogenase [Hypoxylon cercidicola]